MLEYCIPIAIPYKYRTNTRFAPLVLEKYNGKKMKVSINEVDVKLAIFHVLGISNDILLKKTRKREVVEARQMFCYIMVKKSRKSYKAIGKMVGYKDHTSVIHAKNTIQDLLDTQESTRADYLAILDYIYEDEDEKYAAF